MTSPDWLQVTISITTVTPHGVFQHHNVHHKTYNDSDIIAFKHIMQTICSYTYAMTDTLLLFLQAWITVF